ncbi:PTS sugar transporter subunit IIB [Clostridium hydrogeniformans]|uniref:PTS sugar transporter subunit IIB n=1 Tax=Clostridium hydrogeniformans TaxID=349933 RepID=UPI000485DC18|nr:PTS sugar transporter subunit IIB [Clostridium hydrogeniformans]
MKRIMLVCSAGMSTSLLVTKMRKAAESKGIEVNINAVSEAEFKNHIDEVDVVLLGPQVRFILAKVKEQVQGKIPVDVINTMDYGMMNGEKVLNHALTLLG